MIDHETAAARRLSSSGAFPASTVFLSIFLVSKPARFNIAADCHLAPRCWRWPQSVAAYQFPDAAAGMSFNTAASFPDSTCDQ
jgi:hypothetical protein